MRKGIWIAVSLFAVGIAVQPPSQAETFLNIALEKPDSYKRTAFKHWIDADKDGCDTRAEVLIAEAVSPPSIGKKCALTGGEWLSPYDKKVQRDARALDVDHLVPLAEAWRSGAWAWTNSKRQEFANDLADPDVLVAVTLSVNRSKADSDIANWLPAFDKCDYIKKWISIKSRYQLSVDPLEAKVLETNLATCSITGLRLISEGAPTASATTSPSATPTNSATPTPTPTQSSVEVQVQPSTPSANSNGAQRVVTPGAFCSQVDAGVTGVNGKGVLYTCKVSATENRLRWRL